MRSGNNIKNKYFKRQSFQPAFTIIELIIVATIIAILAAIVFVSYSSWRQSTVVAQLKSDLNGAVAAMENYRNFNSGYPADITTITTFTPSSGVALSGGSSDGGLTYCVAAVSSQLPSLPYHIDSTNSGTGATAGICVSQKTLTTIAGAGGTVSPASNAFPTGSVQTITATPNTNFAFSSWTGDTGCSGTASHTITMDTNKTCTANFVVTAYVLTIIAGSGGTVNSGGAYAPGSTPTITATPNTNYAFSSWTGDTGCSGTASHTITMDNNKSCTANFTPTIITPPAAPTVTVTPGSSTTFSWGAASCPGNTARYQYDYTITPSGYDSTWTPTAGLSVTFTTTTPGQTYTVAVQAQCYTGGNSSAWSTPINSGSYSPFECTGCTITYSGAYTVYTFASNGTFITHVGGTISYLVIGGGGGGGNRVGGGWPGGGGGGGGFKSGTASLGISSFPIGVGGGGGSSDSMGGNGGNSSFNGVISTGGGGGGGGDDITGSTLGTNGGSGGGGYSSTTYGNGIAGQGNNAGTSYGTGTGIGGGGGAGSVGGNASSNAGGNAGSGAASSITGTTLYYSSGGPGGGFNSNGGNGSCSAFIGCGGGESSGGYGGVVIIRYPQ